MGKTHGTASALRKSREFIGQLETYLNQKLVEAGKAPVIDFYRSLYAENFVPQNPAALARLALSVLSHHFSFFTLKFTLRTLAQAGRRAMRLQILIHSALDLGAEFTWTSDSHANPEARNL